MDTLPPPPSGGCSEYFSFASGFNFCTSSAVDGTYGSFHNLFSGTVSHQSTGSGTNTESEDQEGCDRICSQAVPQK